MSHVTAAMFASTAGDALSGIISFLLWVLVMVWTYTIARRKGRHAVPWTIFAFFFWVIALIVILLMPSKRATDAYRSYR